MFAPRQLKLNSVAHTYNVPSQWMLSAAARCRRFSWVLYTIIRPLVLSPVCRKGCEGWCVFN